MPSRICTSEHARVDFAKSRWRMGSRGGAAFGLFGGAGFQQSRRSRCLAETGGGSFHEWRMGGVGGGRPARSETFVETGCGVVESTDGIAGRCGYGEIFDGGETQELGSVCGAGAVREGIFTNIGTVLSATDSRRGRGAGNSLSKELQCKKQKI